MIPNEFLIPLLTFIFTAGGAWALMEFKVKQLRKEVNGVGSKTGKIVLYLSETAEGTKRERLTDILR